MLGMVYFIVLVVLLVLFGVLYRTCDWFKDSCSYYDCYIECYYGMYYLIGILFWPASLMGLGCVLFVYLISFMILNLYSLLTGGEFVYKFKDVIKGW